MMGKAEALPWPAEFSSCVVEDLVLELPVRLDSAISVGVVVEAAKLDSDVVDIPVDFIILHAGTSRHRICITCRRRS